MNNAMQDRIIVNIGAAAVVAEPVVGRENELALYVVDIEERLVGRRKLGVDKEAAVNIIDAAKGFFAHTAEQAIGWLTDEVAAECRERPPLAA